MMGKYLRSTRGAAAAELALWLAVLFVPVLNVVDLGFYCFQAIQVRTAAQAAAQSAEELCGAKSQTTFPASQNCTGLSSQLTAAAQSTSLGTQVTVVTATTATTYTTEGYYCSDASGVLTATPADPATKKTTPTNPWALNAASSTITSFPADCTSVNAKNTGNPGDYLAVTVTYTYAPLFRGVSVANLFGGAITQTSWIRLG